MRPAEIARLPGPLNYDPDSSVTAAQKRAPYGDSYQIDRFERPFLQDLTYVPELDIVSFNLSKDADWYYVSIGLVGNDPNKSIGIDYGVEINLKGDGFGNYILWAHPPYTTHWDTSTVKVFKDSNHDTGGLSGERSDAVLKGDGYDTLLFDGGAGENADPDLVWVRMVAGSQGMIEFAFKRSWIGPSFMFGAVADAGLKDVSMYDYNDRFTQAAAGSPVRASKYYPPGALYAVDNTCWAPYGLHITGDEPKLCPPLQGSPTKRSGKKESAGCQQFDASQCFPLDYDPNTCQCVDTNP